MPAPKGDEYWARWAHGYCQVAMVSRRPAADYGAIVDMKPKTVSMTVKRLRESGILVPKSQGNHLTPRALTALKATENGYVAFELLIRAETKTKALAQVWDVISQLEHWDPRTGEPFRLKQPNEIRVDG